MGEWIARMDSVAQATDTYAALESGVDGGTPGSIKVSSGRSAIRKYVPFVVMDGAQTADVGNTYTVEFGKNAVDAPHEVPAGTLMEQDVGTAATAFYVQAVPGAAMISDLGINLKASSDQTLRNAYGGTDPGTPELYTYLELV